MPLEPAMDLSQIRRVISSNFDSLTTGGESNILAFKQETRPVRQHKKMAVYKVRFFFFKKTRALSVEVFKHLFSTARFLLNSDFQVLFFW